MHVYSHEFVYVYSQEFIECVYSQEFIVHVYSQEFSVYLYSQELHLDCALGTLHAMTQNLNLQGVPTHLTTLNMTTILSVSTQPATAIW